MNQRDLVANDGHFRLRVARVSGSPQHPDLAGSGCGRVQMPGRLMCIIMPSGFEGFFEEIGALTPQQQQDIPHMMEIAKKFGLEIMPPA